MDTIIWIIVVGLPVAMLIHLFGWLAGFNSSQQMTNWGTGYDDGWKAHKELTEKIMGGNDDEDNGLNRET